MPSYPKQHQSFLNLLISSFKFYPAAFMTILPFSFLAGLAAALYVYIVNFAQGGWTAVCAFSLIALVQIYFFACGLRRMDARFLHEKTELKKLCIETLKEMGLVYAGFFLCILIFSLVFGLGYAIVKIISILVPENSQLMTMVMLVFVGMPLLFLSVWLSFFVPQLIIDGQPLSTSLVNTFKRIAYKNWPAAFFLYVLLLLLVYFGAPGSKHMEWITQHSLLLPFFVALYVLWLPIIVNYILLFLNRIKPR